MKMNDEMISNKHLNYIIQKSSNNPTGIYILIAGIFDAMLHVH